MQELAKSWIVLNLVGTSSAMGALIFASAIPNLLIGPFAGALADRSRIRNILIITQLLLSVLAFALGLLVSTGSVELWHLVVFSLLEGSVIAFDLPAFNKITPQVVPREDFQQALAMNAVNFHTSRVVGPSIAGVLMATLGDASVFWLNAASFLALVLVISRIPSLSFKTSQPEGTHGMGEAWRFIRGHATLYRVVLQLFLVIGLMFPLVFTIFRVYMQNRFQLDAQHFGLVFAAPGFGALMGSVTFLLWSPREPLKALPFGIGGVIFFLIFIAEVDSLWLAVTGLTCFSYFMFLSISSLNVTIQLGIGNEIRGRVAALVGMAFVSLGPIMSVPIGLLADHMGERPLMIAIANVFAVASFLLFWSHRTKAKAS
jgi:MFS family permease